jgi:hypothetical protein
VRSAPKRLWAPAAALALAACGGKPPPPPPPNPPSVSITTPSASIVDVQLPFSVSVSGCNTVSSLSVYDGTNFLIQVTYAANPTSGALQANQIHYTSGIAAHLSLNAQVTCDDGRSATSQPVGVTFLPVAQVVSNANGNPVVPDLFYAEGSGAQVTFVGCSGLPNGNTTIVRVDANGNVVAYNQNMPFHCSDSAFFTDKGPNGMRWMMEPNVGVMAFDSSLNTMGYSLGQFQYIGIGPDGDAVVWNASGASSQQFGRLSAATGGEVWTFEPKGVLTGNPIVLGTGVLIPERYIQLQNQSETLLIESVAYDASCATATSCPNLCPTPTSTCPITSSSGENDLEQVPYSFLNTPPAIPTWFSSDGSIIYIPYQTALTASTVIACSTTAGGCSQPPNMKWSASFQDVVELALPFSTGGSQIAAIAAQSAWFLNSSTGALLNAGGQPILPTGALVTSSVEPGLGKDIYILNGNGSSLPTEIVGVDDPALGEVFRYDIPTGTLTAAVDDSGQAWLRFGPKLVKPLALSWYRQVHP